MFRLPHAIFMMIFLATLAACATPTIPLHGELGAGPPASIVLPEQLEVVTVNGLEIKGSRGLLAKGDTTLEVSPGRYEVLAFYRELWDRGDQHDMLRSDPALFVVEAAAGERYRLDYSRPGTTAEARALAEDFKGWVEHEGSGKRTPSSTSGLQFRRGLVASATFDDTLVPVAPTGGNGQHVAPLPAPAAMPVPAPMPAAQASAPVRQVPAPSAPVTAQPAAAMTAQPAPLAPPGEGEDWLGLMKGWWSEASAEERREFLRWVGERR